MNWYRSLPAAEAQVPCGTGTHTVRWEAGQLVLPAHPDAEAELVLGALGGDKPRCIELAETWARHTRDLEVLAAGPRDAADRVTVGWDEITEHVSGWFGLPSRTLPAPLASRPQGGLPGSTIGRGAAFRAGGVGGPPARLMPTGLGRGPAGALVEEIGRRIRGRAELLHLLALGPAFQFRLAGTVTADWAGDDQAEARMRRRPELTAALSGRVALAARSWLGIDPDAVTVTPHEGPGWGTLEVSGGGAARRLRAALPVSWLAGVWACGLAVVGGHLVITAEQPGWPRARVLALPAPGAGLVSLDVHATDDPEGIPHWEITGKP